MQTDHAAAVAGHGILLGPPQSLCYTAGMTPAWLVLIVFVAAALQALTGFGFALIVMPLVTLLLPLRTAAPLVAMAGFTAYAVNLVRYRDHVDWREVARLAAASALGIPLGIWALGNLRESLIDRILGVLLVAFGIYTLAGRPTPRLRGRWWFLPAGLLAGSLGAAYNTPGPPVIVYGSLRDWPRGRFKAIIQTLFFVNGILIVGSHLVAGNVTAEVWGLYALAAPTLLAGLWAGARLDRRVNAQQFRTLVTALVLVLGLSLVSGLGRG